MANTKLGIEFEHVNMLKIQSVWNLSDAFAVILPQQRPVLVSAHMKDIYHIYNFVERLFCEFSCIVGVKVAQSYCKITEIEAYLRTQTNYFLQNIL